MLIETVPQRYEAVVLSNIRRHPVWMRLDAEARRVIEVVAEVLPFKANGYVIEHLIDWSKVPEDPIFQLTFPQRGMLEPEQFAVIERALREGDRGRLAAIVVAIRSTLNPHPAGQMTLNVPTVDGQPFHGAQHKYRETLLFFPAAGQTCHAYCTFCFRWPQFVGSDQPRFSARDDQMLRSYLASHPEITDLLLTGGDPMVMKTDVIARYLEPLLSDPALSHVQTVRIGTKSLAYWPQRFTSDADADDLLRLFERVVASGRTLSVQAHASHPVEFEPLVARQAIQRIRSTGAVIRLQSPCIRHVNDDAGVWRDLWNTGVRLGCIPYYFFVERDTGARRYFELPLVRCHEIFRDAYSSVSGLARTVRGPSMSATPGKVHILGRQTVGGEDVFVLQYLQCRRPELVRRPFFAKFDPNATWFDQLEPLGEGDAPFFPRNWPGVWSASMGARGIAGAPDSIVDGGVRVPLRIAVDEA
jgi:L-lysine 2,3-aminomutase